jgi:hypothetical protein
VPGTLRHNLGDLFPLVQTRALKNESWFQLRTNAQESRIF